MLFSKQLIPPKRTKQRPGGYRFNFLALFFQLICCLPYFAEPAHLLFAMTIDMRFCNRDGLIKSLRGLPK
jgi:hypothetical protein